MIRKIVCVLMMVALFLTTPCIADVCYAENGEGDTKMENITVALDTAYGRHNAKWEKPFVAVNNDYVVYVQAVDEDGTAKDLFKTDCYYNIFTADDYVAYVCQEYGFPYLVRLRVECSVDGETVAEGISDTFDPREIYPEKEILKFGTDIPLDAIRAFSWDSAGMSIEANWHIGVSHYGDEYIFTSSQAGQGEKEKKIKKSDWDEIVSIIAKGYMKRDYIMDPEMVVLDGGGEGFALSWKDNEHENYQSYYSYKADEETEEELQRWLQQKDKTTLKKSRLFILISSIVAAAGGVAVLLFKFKR